MGIYIEVFILYVILFLSGSAPLIINGVGEASGFSIITELSRIFLYSIPSLALVWYLLIKGKGVKSLNILPCKNDLVSGLIALPCLFITGLLFAFISSYTGETPVLPVLYTPSGIMEWIILCFSLLCAAYLEESFFRFYILSKRDELKLGAVQAMVFSAALFSICHLYEGLWGVLNSVVSGMFLCIIFLRYKSLHGISIAHAIYNITAYVIAGYSV